MDNEEKAYMKRFCELSSRAYINGYCVFSDFLNLEEQNILLKTKTDSKYELFGGYELAERKMACFYDSYIGDYPMQCIKISPLIEKFADNLNHRDFLGSLMGLGIKRELLGDILINANTAYLFCCNKIADYICQNLNKVRHTSVKCEVAKSVPSNIVPKPKEAMIIVSSKRIDVLVASVFKLSRNDTLNLFSEKKVFVNNKLTENNSYQLKNNELVSVRSKGRFILAEFTGETKKGRQKALVKIFE